MKRRKSTFVCCCVVLLALCLGSCGNDDEMSDVGDGVCSVSLSVSNLPDFREATTRAVLAGQEPGYLSGRTKSWQTLDVSQSEARVAGSDETLPLTSQVCMEYDDNAVGASTRTFNPANLFGANSKFRMLVFKSADMDKPIKNMVCQVNAAGNGASFLSPSTELSLPVGSYVFVCFPEKFNPWAVGQSASATNCHLITLNQDEDFVCLKTGTVNLSTSAYSLDLSTFTRYGYQLTVNFRLDNSQGYLTSPTGQFPLTLSCNGSTNRIINTSATFNLRDKAVSNIGGNHSITTNVQINGSGSSMTYTGATYYLISNPAATGNKLTVTYPSLSVMTQDRGVKTITGGTLNSDAAVVFQSGYAYTYTFEIVDNITVTFRNAAGAEKKVVFAKGSLYYDKSKKTWGIGSEQCDYGYVENNVTPGTDDMKLVDGNISYYFMYGMLESCGRATTGYYTGMDDVPVANDPCSKLPGGKWRSPSRDVFWMMGEQGSNHYNGFIEIKDANDYYAVDENGNRLASFGNLYWGSYTPTDGRSNKTAIPGMWVGLSQSAASTAGTSKAYNKSKLFLPAAGYRRYTDVSVINVGSYGYYWSSQSSDSSTGESFSLGSSNYYLTDLTRSNGMQVRCSQE